MILIRNSFYIEMGIWLGFLQNARESSMREKDHMCSCFCFFLFWSSRSSPLFDPFLYFTEFLGENIMKKTPLHMMHNSFLLMFDAQWGTVRSNSSGQWVYSGKLSLPPICVCQLVKEVTQFLPSHMCSATHKIHAVTSHIHAVMWERPF